MGSEERDPCVISWVVLAQGPFGGMVELPSALNYLSTARGLEDDYESQLSSPPCKPLSVAASSI